MIKLIFTRCNEKEFSLVRRVRDSVFVEEQHISPLEEADEYDSKEDTDFLVLLDNDEPVATMRIAYMPKYIKIGRIAVMKKYRGRHYGAIIVSTAVKKLFDKGVQSVYLESQKHAVGFYETLGFTVCGEELVDRGILHLPMIITPETFKGDMYVKEEE